MAIEIRVHKKFSARANRARLKRTASRVLKAEKNRGDVSIYVATDSEIRLLNRKFHATNAVTDVLSFPSNDPDYLGDIVISYERARVQARRAHWNIAEELDLLAAHGVLHLLGYDDLTPRQRTKMWKRQKEILGKVNE